MYFLYCFYWKTSRRAKDQAIDTQTCTLRSFQNAGSSSSSKCGTSSGTSGATTSLRSNTLLAVPIDEVRSLAPVPAAQALGVPANDFGVTGADRGFRPGSAMAASGDLGGSEKCGTEAAGCANAEEEEEGAAARSSFSLDSTAAAEARRPPALAPGAAIAEAGGAVMRRSEVESEWERGGRRRRPVMADGVCLVFGPSSAPIQI